MRGSLLEIVRFIVAVQGVSGKGQKHQKKKVNNPTQAMGDRTEWMELWHRK